MTEINEINLELKKSLLSYLEKSKVNVDSEIRGVIDQVFEEFDFTSQDDAISIYFKDSIAEMQEDLTLNNTYDIKVNGVSSGSYTATYTYTDNIEYVINENTDLYYDDEVVENLLSISSNEKTKITNPNEWVITVTETIDFGNNEFTRIPRLYMYCPFEEGTDN